MAADTDLTDVIETLTAKRAEHIKAAEVLDQAIAQLRHLAGGGSPGASVAEPSGPVVTTWPMRRRSVKQAVVDLLNEAARDWAVDEIIAEYKRRGEPIDAKDPANALFSATSRLSRSGEIVRTSHGRYTAKKYASTPAAESKGGGPEQGGLKLATWAPPREAPSE